jgi:hypothetical protein
VKNPSLAVALVVSAVLLLGGCGNKSESASDNGPSTSAAAKSTSPSPSATTSSGTSSSMSSSSPSGTPQCRTTGLKVTLGPGEGAAGSTFFPLVIKNVSKTACRTGGFGGVSLVSAPTGQPIGAPADRTQKSQAKPIVLQSGQVATATVQVTSADNYPASKCSPKQATGFRVYPPNETRSAFVAHKVTACGSSKVHLLTVRPYRAG